MPETTQERHLLESPIAARTVREGTEIEDIYGMAQPVAIDDPMLEYRAVREGVGLLDFSPLLKVDIEGPDAKRKLNRLHTRDLEKVPTGRIAYGTILNEARRDRRRLDGDGQGRRQLCGWRAAR